MVFAGRRARGDLRPQEIKYIALLIRHANRLGKLPVFGFCRSVGRLPGLKKQFSGIHIFQYRNLWTQWMSILRHKRSGNDYFIRALLFILLETKDPFLSATLGHDLLPGGERGGLDCELRIIGGPLRRRLVSVLAARLSEQDLFSLYFALHIYVYVVAQLQADIIVDLTKAARDHNYRATVREQLISATGIPISLNDIADRQQYHPFDAHAVDWPAIEDTFEFAVQSLEHVYDRQKLLRIGSRLINETRDEMRLSERYLARARIEIGEVTRESEARAAAILSLRTERDRLAAERDAAIAERDRLAGQHEIAVADADRLVRERDAANSVRDGLVTKNIRLAGKLNAAVSTGVEQARQLEALRREHRHLAADRDCIEAECKRWFDAAIVAGAERVLNAPPRCRWHRFYEWARCLRLAFLKPGSRDTNLSRSPRIRADQARDARQWERAARFYLDALGEDPHGVAMWTELGNALEQAGKPAEAQVAYSQARLNAAAGGRHRPARRAGRAGQKSAPPALRG